MDIIINNKKDELSYIRDLAKKYSEYAVSDEINSRRKAWAEHNSLNFTKPLIYIRAIPFDEFYDPGDLKCVDPALRNIEYEFKLNEYRRNLEDDYIFEPFVKIKAAVKTSPLGRWGLSEHMGEKTMAKGASPFKPTLFEGDDLSKIFIPAHEIDEEATKRIYERYSEIYDGNLNVYTDRQGVLCDMWAKDISTSVTKFLGMENLMLYMIDSPEWLSDLLSFMRDKILKNIEETEAAGDFKYLNHENQAMPYAVELKPPSNEKSTPSQMWGYMAAQEYTLVSPVMFDEFLFQYQKPILEKYALTAYGCCEDLTEKIPVIKKLKNLRRIGVAPLADLKKCAEQIQSDYILSWRPNPSDMVSFGINEDYIRKYIQNGMDILKENNCKYDITLKDVETASNDRNAIINWTHIVRDMINKNF